MCRQQRPSPQWVPSVSSEVDPVGTQGDRTSRGEINPKGFAVAETMEADGKGKAQPPTTMKKGEGVGSEPTSKSGTDKSAAKALQEKISAFRLGIKIMVWPGMLAKPIGRGSKQRRKLRPRSRSTGAPRAARASYKCNVNQSTTSQQA